MSIYKISEKSKIQVYFKSFLQICIFVTLIFISSCSDKDTNPVASPNETINKAIDNVCDSLLKATPEMTGMIVGIWDNTKNFTYVKGIGISDKATNKIINTDMLSRVGSVTKTFTTTIALQLVDQGKLKLSDSITKYLPEYPQLWYITVEMLCNMTSGIPDFSSDKNFATLLLGGGDKYKAPAELVKIALGNPMIAPPGAVYHYSSTNTILLGMIIEKITGQKIETLVQNNLIAPVGLTNTYFPTVKVMPTSNFLHGYTFGLDFAELVDPSWAWAAGGMISNIYDLKKWVETLVKGNLLSADLQQKRFESPVTDNGRIYGLGISTIGNNLWGHSGTIPGYETVMMTDRTKDRTYVIFFNTYTDATSPESLLNKILAIIN